MKIIFATCSEGVAVDRYTNKLSIFSVIDKVASFAFPFWLPRVCVAIAAQKEEGDDDRIAAKLTILLGGSRIAETDAILPFQKDGTARIVLNFNLAIPSPGLLQLRLDTATAQLELYQITVTQISPAQVPVDATPGLHTLADAPPPSY